MRSISDLRISADSRYGRVNAIERDVDINDNCLIHNQGNHKTEACRQYISLSIEEKLKLLREKWACYGCLLPGHLAIECTNRVPCVAGCDQLHHPSLHRVRGGDNHFEDRNQSCMLQI